MTQGFFSDERKFDFNKVMGDLGGIVKEARRKEAIETLRTRIRRCEELLTYALALNQVATSTEAVADAMEVDIAFIRSELSEWASELPEITTYQGIVSVVLQIKAYSIKNLNELFKKE